MLLYVNTVSSLHLAVEKWQGCKKTTCITLTSTFRQLPVVTYISNTYSALNRFGCSTFHLERSYAKLSVLLRYHVRQQSRSV